MGHKAYYRLISDRTVACLNLRLSLQHQDADNLAWKLALVSPPVVLVINLFCKWHWYTGSALSLARWL